MAQNYPNPFNPTTTIQFALPSESLTVLEIFNVAGQQVLEQVSGVLPAGNHAVQWNGRDDAGRILASGLYIIRLPAGTFIAHKKIVMMK